MLTQNHAAISTAIRLEHSHMGIQAFLSDQLMGTIEIFPSWGLDILPAGVGETDEVFVTNNQPYRLLEQAVAAVTAEYLAHGRIEIPDYM
ncbi:hypothetical protein [Chamaesiphon minutus]|uniref:Uncharacterized protein n=1 Tax=Chamaesiphon minutus (strain ATCC 27169 / PCC 6605) TaxID=1173020 RepID=K9UKX7_CHAP6|nr:hypothetical protein [Chamaesiphon minutus]AFY95485.1 hypothetical protein Cha6605_4566 [Chamaesiphon minutus PCC 6605]